MRVLLVGGNSSVAAVLRPVLSSFAEVLTAGRSGCDIEVDLSWPVDALLLPSAIDVVVNTAAVFGDHGFEAFLAAEVVNVIGALKVCRIAQRCGASHVVHISSMSAVQNAASAYYGIYSVSKKQGDELVQLYCDNAGLLYTILRPSQLYGEDAGFRKHQPFLYNALDKVTSGNDIIIYGSRAPLRNYLHAKDFCRLIAATIQQSIGGIYQCTNAEDINLRDVANIMINIAKSDAKVIFDRSKMDIPDNIFPYDDLIYRKTGIYPEIGIEAGVSRLVADKMSSP